ncbi:MAG: hypothetical protein IMZ69_03985 [Spirochaetes bacterium]|nr:hypothetical protein [Spirochaetota bacterium]
MLRNVRVTVEGSSWPSGRPPAAIAALSEVKRLDVLLALAHTALWTRPPRIYGFDLSDCWAWMRYGPAISARPALQLRTEWTDLDPHHKTILSDEFGVGFTTYLLADALRCLEYVNTTYAVARVFPGRFRQVNRSKRGPSKAPDYIARLPNGRFAVLECKGTQTSGQALQRAMVDGRTQKRNVTSLPGTKIEHSLIGGLFIPQSTSRQAAEIVIADPEATDLAILLKEASTEALSLATVQVAVSQQLALAGLWEAANLVARQSVDSLDEAHGPLVRLFEGQRRSSVRHVIPFTSDDGADRPATFEFRFDVAPLVASIRDGRSLPDALGEIADLSARTAWVHGSSDDDKSAVVRTPYDTKLSLAIVGVA